MESYMFEKIGVIVLIAIFGWFYSRQSHMELEMDFKVNKDDFVEVKEDMKNMLKQVTELRIDLGRWQEKVERIS